MKRSTVLKGNLILLACTGLLLVASSAYGQVVNGIIVGTVTDASGAVIPQAKVTVTDIGTGVNRVLTTDSRGYYSVPNLPPGT